MTIRGGKQMPFLKIKEQQLKRKYDTPIKQAIKHLQGGAGSGGSAAVLHGGMGRCLRIIRRTMEQRFSNNSLDLETLREFCKREGF